MIKREILVNIVLFLVLTGIGYIIGIQNFIANLNELYDKELQPKLTAALEERDSSAFKYWTDQVVAFTAQRKNLTFLLNPLNWIKHSGWKPIPYFPSDKIATSKEADNK